MKTVVLKFCTPFIVITTFILSADAQKIRVVPDADSAKILSIKVARDLPDSDLSEKIEKDARGRSTLRENPDKIRQAFILCVASGSKEVTSCVTRVFVTDLGTDQTYEIAGEELFIEANRPITGLKWVNDDVLSYERWAGPHYGHRYVVNAKLLKQTGAFILSDQ
jgi:hypothetical protein